MSKLLSQVAFMDGPDLARHRAWFAANLKRLMDDRKLRPRAVASAVHASESDLSRWRKGRIPSDDALESLADYFGVEVADLLRNPSSKASSLQDAGLIDLVEELAKRLGLTIDRKGKPQ